EKFTESKIDVLAIPSTAEIFLSSPFVDEVIILEKKGKKKSIFSLVKFVRELRKKNYTKIFSPHRSLRTSIIIMLLNVRETYGFNNSSLKHVYKYLIDYEINNHEVQRNLDLIDYEYSDGSWRILPEIKISAEQKKNVSNFLGEYKNINHFSAVAPGSVWETKKYPVEYFEKVIQYLVERSFSVFIIGGKDDGELCNNLAKKFNNQVISAAGKFTLIETIELLKSVEILISNDSAPTHLGMCANISVLTLYCSTVSNFGFYPYNSQSDHLSYDDLPCKPCGIHGYHQCPIKTFECGYNLKPEIVINKIEEMLNDRN
ncbi:MAG: glycosyltransferase family 9 protein, partial [Ignavibacteriaceae bacterium]